MNVNRDGGPVRRKPIDAMRGGRLRSHQDPVAVAAGVAPGLSIDLTERAGIFLVGILRDEPFSMYTHRERVQ